MKEAKVTLKIPRPLYRKIQMVVEESGFSSPTDFIVFVLRDVMGEAEKHRRPEQEKEEYSPSDLEAVKSKLRNLGYL